MNLNQARHFALYAIPCAALLAACADENTTQITEQTGLATIASGESLAECSEENSGEMVFVSDSSAVYYCDGSSWQTLNGKDGKDGTDGSNGNSGECCLAEAIDGGYKIVCGGDSVGVLLNGKNGNDGENGENGADGKSSVDTVYVSNVDTVVINQVDTLYLQGLDGASCTAEPLDDASGYKIVCGGDSVGVLLNGKDGTDGKDGADGKDCDCQKESESNVEPDSIATVILNAEIQPPIVGISLFGAYKDADEKGVLLCSDESGCSLEKSEENAYIGTKESGNTSFFGFNDPSKNTQTIKMRMEKFAYSQGYGRIVGLNGTTGYMVKAYAVLKKDTVYGTAEKFTTISFNRSPKTLDYSNVWQNSSYTIFDIATDEILSGKTYYFTSNENTNMRTSCGQVGCYKVRDSIHNDLWVQMMFGYGIHKVIIPPAFKLENGLLSITASAEIDDAVDKFYYSINGDPLDFASWTNKYTGPVKVESGDVVHAYIKTAKGYLSTPNSFIVE